jgi:hypothetical protein
MKLDSKKETAAFFDRLPIVTICYIPFFLGGGDFLFQRENGDCSGGLSKLGPNTSLGELQGGVGSMQANVTGKQSSTDATTMKIV